MKKPLLAASRLWLLYLRQGQPDRAEDVFQSLAAHAGAKDAALYVPGEFSFDPMEFHNTKSGLQYLHARPEDCERIARTTHTLEVLGYPPLVIDIHYQLLIRYRWTVGQTDEALKDAASWLSQCDRKKPAARLGDAWFALLSRAWLLGTLGKDRARQAVGEIDDRIAPYRAVPDRDAPDYYVLCLLERARLQCVLEDWGAAEQDVAACRRILGASPGPGYLAWSETALTEGFLLERRGQAEAAREAWRRGTARAYQAAFHAGDLGLFGTAATVNVLLAAACGDLDDATAEQTMNGILRMGPEGMAGRLVGQAHVTPADLRAALLSPRAHDVARRYAFGQVSFPDWMRAPILLLAVEKVRAGAFPDGLSPEQEEIVWRMAERFLALYASDGLSETQLLQLAYAWTGGFGAAGPLGYGAVAPKLSPEVRGPLAYVLANRLVQKKSPADAEGLFRAALAEAPADSPLHRLAQADLDRLTGGRK